MMTISPLRLMPTTATVRTAHPELTPEDLSIAERSRSLWRLLRENAGVMARLTASPKVKWIVYRLHREDDRSDPLELLAKLIVQLASLGVPETFFRRVVLFVTEVVDDCFTGAAHQSRAELDRLAFIAEQRENAFEHARHTSGEVTPELLDAEAEAILAECAVEYVKARQLHREARQMRAGLVLA